MLCKGNFPTDKIMQAWSIKEKPKGNYWNTMECFSCFTRSRKIIDSSRSFNSTPVVAITILPDAFERSKPSSPQETPDKLIIQRSVMTSQPFSSGSDSSGYFTPPADPPETYRPASRSLSRNDTISDRFIKLETPTQLEGNFKVLADNESEKDFVAENGETSENVKRSNTLHLENSFDESRSEEDFKSDEEEDENGDEDDDVDNDDVDGENISVKSMTLEEKAFDEVVLPRDDSFNFDEIDFNQVPNPDKNVWSKSEIKLNESPEISRKAITSAPSEHLKAIEYKPFDETPIMPPKTALPGSIDFEQLNGNEPSSSKANHHIKKLKPPLTRKLSCRTPRTDAKSSSEILRPFSKPRDAFVETINQLGNLEWEYTMKGLQGLTRLIRFHPEIVDSNMHAICVALGKHIRNLRSQVARSACTVATEIFKDPKRSLEMELEELAAPLLHRTADTNKFLRSDANAALDEMCSNMSTPRVVGVITSRGSSHPNAVVRCASARLLCSLVQRMGAERLFQMPRETRDRILYSSANMLLEGSLETRKHAKMLFGLLCNHTQFNRAMTEAVPTQTMRHIAKTLKTLK